MWKAIKLALMYYVMQMLGALVMMPFAYGWSYVTTGTIDEGQVNSQLIPLSMFAGVLFMLVYLWKTRNIAAEDILVSATGKVFGLVMLAGIAKIFLIDVLTTYLQLPDLMESTFNLMQSGLLGILCITLFGPVLEELLFRGAIMKALSKRFSPMGTIVISALIFGLIHINPIQVVAASLSGLLFGYVYYVTRSLLPCILLHVFNNSMSVYLDLTLPEVDSLTDFMDKCDVLFWIFVSIIVLAFSVRMLWRERQRDFSS